MRAKTRPRSRPGGWRCQLSIGASRAQQALEEGSKAAQGLETLAADQRHTLRKELKKLRYSIGFFAPLFPTKRVDPFLKELKNCRPFSVILTARRLYWAMFAGAETPGAGDWTTQRAIGWVMGAGQALAAFGWSNAQALWRGLKEMRPFWKIAPPMGVRS